MLMKESFYVTHVMVLSLFGEQKMRQTFTDSISDVLLSLFSSWIWVFCESQDACIEPDSRVNIATINRGGGKVKGH